MALTDYRPDAMRCTRCSYCKWIPFDLVRSHRFAKGCPSVEAGKFHAYSAGGKLVTALSLMDGRSEVTDQVVDIAFKCQLCGNCDVACKLCRYDMEPVLALREFRAHLVEMDRVPESYRLLIAKTRAGLAGKSPVTPAGRNTWAEGLGLKDPAAEPADVVFYAGCKYSMEESLRETVRTQVRLLQLAGLTVGLFENGCCGGLADKMGYRDEAAEAGARMLAQWAAAGVRTVVTPCADCRHVFTRVYPDLEGARAGMPEILHTIELTDRLIDEERLELTTPVPMTVTYHDPCNLGRQGEPYEQWEGVEKKIYGQAVVYDPPRPRHNGAHGVYDAPRDVLAAIPGVELVEMERSREAAWCCGAGGACREAFPEYSAATAAERVEEAASTGADALVTACSRCELNFNEAVAADSASNGPGAGLQVHDVLEMVALSAGLKKEAS
ncbi:MAG: (Fe-S)-binding protein [Deltaproteobacteria bacterium]